MFSLSHPVSAWKSSVALTNLRLHLNEKTKQNNYSFRSKTADYNVNRSLLDHFGMYFILDMLNKCVSVGQSLDLFVIYKLLISPQTNRVVVK